MYVLYFFKINSFCIDMQTFDFKNSIIAIQLFIVMI